MLDTELAHLPPDLRWREWMGRVEAVIFAASQPVTRETLARIVGRDCSLELIIDDIREELRGRPYELVAVAGGWQHRTRPAYAEIIRAATGQGDSVRALSQNETLVLAAIAYYQPITRSELSAFFGKEVSRDLIASLRSLGVIASGPRSPQPGAPYTYVTTKSVPLPVRALHAARPAGFRGAGGCRAALQGEAACWGYSRCGVRRGRGHEQRD